jgi:hypothetical protein
VASERVLGRDGVLLVVRRPRRAGRSGCALILDGAARLD